MSYTEGKQAALNGKKVSDNPYVIGYTKLGSPKLSDEGLEWENGFRSVGRWATKVELEAAARMDISQFRRKSNRYYK